MDEITRLRSFRVDVTPPSASVVDAARGGLLTVINAGRTPRRSALQSRRALVVAMALVCLLTGAGALAATGVLGDDILGGRSAPHENDAALRALFPPYGIGHATELAAYEDRKLFGARTAKGGYCFSATSPTDPKGEGGHCVSEAEARTLDAGGTVAFAMSGWSVGGYAPGATSVHVAGAGVEVTAPVGVNGWWVGVAELPRYPLREGQESATVVATSIGPDSQVLGEDPLMLVRVARTASGRVIPGVRVVVAFN
jgi:hypothetical protein